MNFIHLVYKVLGNAFAMALLPSIWLHHNIRGQDLDRFHQRLGSYPPSLRQHLKGAPRIWLHAVSVGEVGVASAVAQALRSELPGCKIALSSTTQQGFARAKEVMGKAAACFYAPLDLARPTQKALRLIRPHFLGLLETEIWPNLIMAAHHMGIPTAILNGRISVRTIKSYRKILPLMRHTLSFVNAFSMISEQDARRIRSLGAPAGRIFINGNAKFDGSDPQTNTKAQSWAMNLLDLKTDQPVFVAGSTRHPEEPGLLDAFLSIRRACPDAVMIIAPRHTSRTAQIEQWVADRGLESQRRSQLRIPSSSRTAPVVILDTMGELPAVYSIATFVFCGGSLVPKGGQNVLEPAMWGKPVMFGPSMDDFEDARRLIESAGGGVTVRSVQNIIDQALMWLQHPKQAKAVGRAARRAILPHRGAASKHAAVIVEMLSKPDHGSRPTGCVKRPV